MIIFINCDACDITSKAYETENDKCELNNQPKASEDCRIEPEVYQESTQNKPVTNHKSLVKRSWKCYLVFHACLLWSNVTEI